MLKEIIDNKLYINPNIVDEGNQMEVIEDNDVDELETIVRCNNCGQPTKYGLIRMCHGFTGCDNIIMKKDGKKIRCYYDDLLPRVIRYQNENYEKYSTGKVYRYRDNAEGGIPNEKDN